MRRVEYKLSGGNRKFSCVARRSLFAGESISSNGKFAVSRVSSLRHFGRGTRLALSRPPATSSPNCSKQDATPCAIWDISPFTLIRSSIRICILPGSESAARNEIEAMFAKMKFGPFSARAGATAPTISCLSWTAKVCASANYFSPVIAMSPAY